MGLLFLILFCAIPGVGISAGLWAIGNQRSRRDGIERDGIERDGIERDGIERDGIERDGIERDGIEEAGRALPNARLRRDVPFLIVVVGLVGGAILVAFGDSFRGLSVLFVLAAVASAVLILVRKRLLGRALWAERVARTLASAVVTILTAVVAVTVVLIVAFITNPPTD